MDNQIIDGHLNKDPPTNQLMRDWTAGEKKWTEEGDRGAKITTDHKTGRKEKLEPELS